MYISINPEYNLSLFRFELEINSPESFLTISDFTRVEKTMEELQDQDSNGHWYVRTVTLTCKHFMSICIFLFPK